MFTDSPARSGSTMGDSAVTVTVSLTEPTDSVKSTSVTAFRRTGALRITDWKPASSAWSSYVPGGRLVTRYTPPPSVTAVKSPSASGLFSEIVTPGSTEPLESTIFPTTVPVVVRWANATRGNHARTANARTARRRARSTMRSPLLTRRSKPNRVEQPNEAWRNLRVRARAANREHRTEGGNRDASPQQRAVFAFEGVAVVGRVHRIALLGDAGLIGSGRCVPRTALRDSVHGEADDGGRDAGGPEHETRPEHRSAIVV